MTNDATATVSLKGRALNFALAVYEGFTPSLEPDDGDIWLEHPSRAPLFLDKYRPSTEWASGGPILDQVRPGFRVASQGMYANLPGAPEVWGADYLEAGLRCVLLGHFGDTFDLPASLSA